MSRSSPDDVVVRPCAPRFGPARDVAPSPVPSPSPPAVGFIEERNAGDAIAALRQQLAPQCHVCRGGEWKNMPARLLVPGDVIELKLGDVVPADGVLLDGTAV